MSLLTSLWRRRPKSLNIVEPPERTKYMFDTIFHGWRSNNCSTSFLWVFHHVSNSLFTYISIKRAASVDRTIGDDIVDDIADWCREIRIREFLKFFSFNRISKRFVSTLTFQDLRKKIQALNRKFLLQAFYRLTGWKKISGPINLSCPTSISNFFFVIELNPV